MLTRGGRSTAHTARRGAIRRLGHSLLGAAIAIAFWGTGDTAAAEPKPTIKQLAAEVESLHVEIETLAEQYNGERVRLKEAEQAAQVAKKTLEKSQAELTFLRRKASALARNSYMNGGLGSALPLFGSADPDTYLDQASTAYTLELQQSQQVLELANAMKAAERARQLADAHQAEVTKLLESLSARRVKINALIKKTESDLYRQIAGTIGNGRRARLSFPIIGTGKAAEAARWALTQQLKPYVWGADGPSSYDCSGLVMAAYQKVGINLPHYTGSQWAAGTQISRDELRPGDLVFFYSDLHHVGIYIGGGYMIHAPRTGDVVRIAKISGRPFAGAVRIAH